MPETKRQIFDRIVTEWGELIQHREGWDDQMREEVINATSAMYDKASDGDPTCQFCHSNPSQPNGGMMNGALKHTFLARKCVCMFADKWIHSRLLTARNVGESWGHYD